MSVADIPINASNLDGYRNCNLGTYPPGSTDNASGSTTGTTIYVERSYNGSTQYDITVGLLRFDTSVLPDDATVSAATLEVYVKSHSDTNTLNLCGEYYDPGTIDSADWTAGEATTAFSTALSGITDSAAKIITLSSAAANISLVSYTGIRLTISKRAADAAPTGNNNVQIASYDDTSFAEPILHVTYTQPGGGGGLTNLMLVGVG